MNTMRGIGFALLATLASGCKEDAAAPDGYSREKLLDPLTCNECHQDHYKEWAGSMHAYASQDPLFLAMNKRGQEETHGELGNFCVNCHAPMAVHELSANGDTIDPATIPPEFQGVTCYFCHNVKEVQGTHNNALVLANDTTMRGGFGGPEPIKHQAVYSPLHDSQTPESAGLCGGCHDIVVPAHFSGAAIDPDAGVGTDGVRLEQTYAEWKGSVFTEKGGGTCGHCHMQTPPGGKQPVANPPGQHPPMKLRNRHLHDFPAVDTVLSPVDIRGFDASAVTAIRDGAERRVSTALDAELRVEICVDPQFGDILVTLENLSAGHNFPSGASQDRRLWVELHVFEKQSDGSERDVYQSGVVPRGGSVAQAAEDAVSTGGRLYLFRDETFKTDGTVAHMFWDVARIKSETIPVATDFVPVNLVTKLYAEKDQTHSQQPSRITAKVWLEPVGIDVIDDLIKSGHLAGGDAMPSLREAMPRRLLVPSRLTRPDADPATLVTLTWDRETALAGNTVGNKACAQTQ